MLVHRQPDGIWRIDFRLPDGETSEQALEPESLRRRIDLVLAMIGKPAPWEMDWATVYSANTLTLPDYVVGRVAFVGDAAHLLPIFGVRGANTGFQDAGNLAWKLALVVKGEAPRALLESYSSERVRAAREICEEGGKSTRFMSPPSAGFRMMRDAVLSFTLSQDFAKDLLHWRTSRPHSYDASPLNAWPDADAMFDGGIAVGDALRNVRLGEDDYLFDHLDQVGFHLLCFVGDDAPDANVAAALRAAREAGVNAVVIGRAASPLADVFVPDREGGIARKYAAAPGGAYLVRPDQHVSARWPRVGAEAFLAALSIAKGGKA